MHTQFGVFCLTAKRPEMESWEFKLDILCIFKLFISVYVSIFALFAIFQSSAL